MPEEIIIYPEDSVLYSAGIKKDSAIYPAAREAAKLYLSQGASFDTAVSNVKAQFGTTTSTPTTTKQPGENRLTINEFGAIANAPKGDPDLYKRLSEQTGLPEGVIQDTFDAAAAGNTNAMATLAALGVEPYATMAANKAGSGGSTSGGGGGGGIAAPSPYEDAKTRQTLALFDPNYPDGALIPLPDGTSRINGTEIIIDTRVKGQFKPVSGADGYLVDPTTGNIIDLNGNQIARSQLEETIRSNRVAENLAGQRLSNDIYGTDLSAELGRGNLALDTTLGVGGLNLQAATSENEQALRNILETNGLNLESYLGTGNLNIGATNAETSRLNALTGRTTAAGQLSADQQKLQDARTLAVIDLMANPNDFVEREYATRALNSPPGYTGPAFRDNPDIQRAIDELFLTPDVGGLLPTYNAPTYQPAVLPNASLPRVTAPAPQPQAQRTAVSTTPSTDITGNVYTNTSVAPENQTASTAFREKGVPDWALAPLGYAYGTNKGTKERQFITGDPQVDGGPNPELNTVRNPGPNTTVEVTPLRDMAEGAIMPDEVTMGREMGNMPASESPKGIDELLAGILIAIANKWGATGGTAQYAYGTDRIPNITRDQLNSTGVKDILGGFGVNPPTRTPPVAGNNMGTLPNNPFSDRPTPPGANTNPTNTTGSFDPQSIFTKLSDTPAIQNYIQRRSTMPNGYPTNGMGSNTSAGMFNKYLQSRQRPVNYPTNGGSMGDNSNFNWQDIYNQLRERFMDNRGTLGINPRMDEGGFSYYAYGTPNNRNVDTQGNYAGPRDSTGNPLGTLTSYADKDIRNLPNIRYAQNAGNATAYNTLSTKPISGPFGSTLPDVGGLNYSQLLNIAQDPDSWGTLSSIYRGANRNLEGMLARIRARAPIGDVTNQSLIRTGG